MRRPAPFDVITIEGLVAGTAPAGGSGLKVGVPLISLLLMPAGGAEIVLPALAPGVVMLRTAGITTGSAGDPWPCIALMHIQAPALVAVTSGMHAAMVPAAVDRRCWWPVRRPVRSASSHL